MSDFQCWQPVKVTNEQSEHHGRAGVVIREEGQGVVVRLDQTTDAPEVLANFAASELNCL